MPLTTTYSSLVTIVYRPWPWTVSTADTSSIPDTVMMQSPMNTLEAYLRDSVVPQTPAGRTWFLVNFKSRPVSVVIYTKVASSLLAPWGIKTTSEKRISPLAFAAKTRSPTRMEDMALTSPDSIIKVSDPAKQDFDDVEVVDTAAVAPAGAVLGDAEGTDTEGAVLGGEEGTGTEDVEGALNPPVT